MSEPHYSLTKSICTFSAPKPLERVLSIRKPPMVLNFPEPSMPKLRIPRYVSMSCKKVPEEDNKQGAISKRNVEITHFINNFPLLKRKFKQYSPLFKGRDDKNCEKCLKGITLPSIIFIE